MVPSKCNTGLYYSLDGKKIKTFLPSVKGQNLIFQNSHPELTYIHFNNLEDAKRWLSSIELRRQPRFTINSWSKFWFVGKHEEVLWLEENAK